MGLKKQRTEADETPNWLAQLSDGHWPPSAGRLCAASKFAGGAMCLSLWMPE